MFRELYNDTIIPSLKGYFGYKSVMAVPKIVKVCLNMGIGEGSINGKVIDFAKKDLSLIAGQCPVVTYAKQSISGFKIRKGVPIGLKVTLRGRKMYEFLERLVYIALPREREFKGFSSKQFDGNGNLNIGIKEHISFLEINYDKIDKIRGLDINIVTNACDNGVAKKLLSSFNFPFIN